MIGAIIGDIVGSIYEFHNIKTKQFPLFSPRCEPTDDSIMSLAVAKSILEAEGDLEALSRHAVANMLWLGNRYPGAGYGGRFYQWLKRGKYTLNPEPYNSFGNGSAMRVSPCGFAAATLDEAVMTARVTAEVTHNHPEGIKGAEATAAAIFLAKTGSSIPEIKAYIVEHYYPMRFTLDQIRPDYRFDVSCQGSVPQALEAFFESTSYEDAIRNAVSIGGDSDTIACIAGGIAEAYWGVPDPIRKEAMQFLDDTQKKLLAAFEDKYPPAPAETRKELNLHAANNHSLFGNPEEERLEI